MYRFHINPFQKGTGQASLQDVDFKYPTRPLIQVLKKFNLEIEKGKTYALVGASGCGKSTVIQLLQRYYDPDGGIVVCLVNLNNTHCPTQSCLTATERVLNIGLVIRKDYTKELFLCF